MSQVIPFKVYLKKIPLAVFWPLPRPSSYRCAKVITVDLVKVLHPT